MHRLSGLFFLLSLCLSSLGPVLCQQEICLTGFIMDTYCVDRGTLLDNGSLRTLEHPDKHSIHCLVDVSQCINGGFEVLVDPPAGQESYCRGFDLGSAGDAMALSLARATGKSGNYPACSTCTNTAANAPTKGFRATVKGTMISAPSGATGPGTMTVTSVEDASVGCGETAYQHPFCSASPPPSESDDDDNEDNDGGESFALSLSTTLSGITEADFNANVDTFKAEVAAVLEKTGDDVTITSVTEVARRMGRKLLASGVEVEYEVGGFASESEVDSAATLFQGKQEELLTNLKTSQGFSALISVATEQTSDMPQDARSTAGSIQRCYSGMLWVAALALLPLVLS